MLGRMDRTPPPSGFDVAAGRRGRVGLVVGPALFVSMLIAGPPEGLPPEAWRTAAAGAWMATWWITEAVPLPATALLPIALFPLLGVAGPAEAAAPFAHPIVFLFLGGFLIALAMERWGLHERVALAILARTGTRPRGMVAGFLLSAAALSLWISNTATTLLLLPIGLSVLELTGRRGREPLDRRGRDSLGAALMLAIAFGASIGGLGTLIGTPPNALTAAFLEEAYGIRIGFARWMAVGLPMVAVALPVAWWILTRVVFRLSSTEVEGVGALVRERAAALGRPSGAERIVAAVFGLAATGWILGPLLQRWVPGLSDAGVAVAAGILLFLLPAGEGRGRVLDWGAAARLPWGVLLLFGGGLSLAAAIESTGLTESMAGALGALADWPFVALVLAVAAITILLSELASNTATAAAFLPVVGAAALAAGYDPILLVVPAGLAASGGFMLPVATPPNAIVYGSGAITVPELARAGGLLDLLFVLLVPVAARLLVGPILG